MSEKNAANRLNSYVNGKKLVLERMFEAPRELVFKTFSESEHLANWWGPTGWTTENKSFDFKPGGVWHFCMTCEDKNQKDFYGQKSWGKVTYHEIIVPEKIVYTDTFSDEEGNVSSNAPKQLITINFEEQSGKTKLIIQSQFESEEALKVVIEMGLKEGMASQFNDLDEYLKQLSN
ncbi:SRPBCC domain-containing protein [Gracilibacillus lacisalsi]|uniref:SRPBCC domain-containing protein n=1 Tax=Gracilibacillus lacisalsi TaxID=393087 RepID=UPI0003642E2B|nr:SRPBCC domain-containing protein [Gracilibacillus lacisalsi]